MASALYVLDLKGKPLIQKHYRSDLPSSVLEHFSHHLLEEEVEVTPVYEHDGVSFGWVKHNNIYLVAATILNGNISMLVAFLHKLIEVFKGYFTEVDEESIRDNFCIIYELLDEAMDFGYPQFTETNILKRYITQEGLKAKAIALLEDKGVIEAEEKQDTGNTSSMTGDSGVPWRPTGIKYRKNELFLDVVERVSLLVSATGETLHSEIHGALEMRSKLSGMPEVKIGLNDKIQFEASGRRTKGRTVDMEDTKFHQCVRLNQFESDRTIAFIPPDGEFVLMNYRLSTKLKPMILVSCQTLQHGQSRVEYSVKCRSSYKKSTTANNVKIIVPVPSDADSPEFKTTQGKAKYAPEKDALVWKIKLMPGGKEHSMTASFGLPSIRSNSDQAALNKKPIMVDFEIPYYTVSGFQVRFLKVTDQSGYEALPWVRYVTKSGCYQVRMN